MRGVRAKSGLAGEGGFEAREGGVEHCSQLSEFGACAVKGDALFEIARSDYRGGTTDALNGLEGFAGQPPTTGDATEEKYQAGESKESGPNLKGCLFDFEKNTGYNGVAEGQGAVSFAPAIAGAPSGGGDGVGNEA